MTDDNIRPVKILFYGIGCRILLGSFNNEEWQDMKRVAKKLNTTLALAVFDPSFYLLLDNTKIHSIVDLGNMYHIFGLLNSYKSIIEIQVYRKRRRSIKFSEIISPTTLFPLYQANRKQVTITTGQRKLVIVEKEIGLFSKFMVRVPSFSIEKLLFEVSNIELTGYQDYNVITNLFYGHDKLISTHGNSLVCEQYALTK